MKTFRIRPIGDQLLVQYLESSDTPVPGGSRAGSAEARPQAASVIALGTGMGSSEDRVGTLKVGATVLIQRKDRHSVKLSRKYTLVRESDVVGLVG